MEGRQGGGMNRGNSNQGRNRAQGGPGRGVSGGNRSGMNQRQEMSPNRHPETGMNHRPDMNSGRHPETGMNRRPDMGPNRHPEAGMNHRPGMGEPRAPHRHGYRMPPFGLGCMGNMGYGDCVLVRDALFQLCHGYRVDPRTMHMVEMFFGRPIHPSEYGDVWRWMDEYVRGW